MTADEKRVIDLLGEAWNAFLKLPIQHADDVPDMRGAIHDAQRIVMSRPAYRQIHGIEPPKLPAPPPRPAWSR